MLLKKKFRLKKNKNFFFGLKKNLAKIYIRKTYSNIFITLTDLRNKVVICKTSGSSDVFKNKRRKRIAQAVDKIIQNINNYIKFYNITHIHLILKMRVKSHVYALVKNLYHYGIIILSICSRRIVAHNGVKGRNLRRL